MSPVSAPPSKPSLRFWYAYVLVVLVVWLSAIFGLGLFQEVLRAWPMAVVMILGSLVAGSTPMGGGAVAFPYLVLWLHAPPDQARTFSLAIQAVGMTSAMIFIFARRVAVQRRILAWTVAGAAGGLLLGSTVLAAYVAPNYVKLTFACLWMSFALLTLVKNREFCSAVGVLPIDDQAAMRWGLAAGVIGGLIASIIGVGVEMALYTVLVLLFRCDLKIAVPTAVCSMGAASVMGIFMQLAWGAIPHDVTMKFLAACPVVIFGAPIGTYILSVIPRIRTLYFISVLCVLQFVWTLLSFQKSAHEWLFVAIAMIGAGWLFTIMHRRGKAASEGMVYTASHAVTSEQ